MWDLFVEASIVQAPETEFSANLNSEKDATESSKGVDPPPPPPHPTKINKIQKL